MPPSADASLSPKSRKYARASALGKVTGHHKIGTAGPYGGASGNELSVGLHQQRAATRVDIPKGGEDDAVRTEGRVESAGGVNTEERNSVERSIPSRCHHRHLVRLQDAVATRRDTGRQFNLCNAVGAESRIEAAVW